MRVACAWRRRGLMVCSAYSRHAWPLSCASVQDLHGIGTSSNSLYVADLAVHVATSIEPNHIANHHA